MRINSDCNDDLAKTKAQNVRDSIELHIKYAKIETYKIQQSLRKNTDQIYILSVVENHCTKFLQME